MSGVRREQAPVDCGKELDFPGKWGGDSVRDPTAIRIPLSAAPKRSKEGEGGNVEIG